MWGIVVLVLIFFIRIEYYGMGVLGEMKERAYWVLLDKYFSYYEKRY